MIQYVVVEASCGSRLSNAVASRMPVNVTRQAEGPVAIEALQSTRNLPVIFATVMASEIVARPVRFVCFVVCRVRSVLAD